MRDPKVESLVEAFYNKLSEANSIWSRLSAEGVYVSMTVENTPSKRLVVDRIDQNIDYKRKPV